jgi:hypothetical protein
MSKKTICIYIIFLSLVVIVNSCTKSQVGKTPEQLLTANAWKATEVRGVFGNAIVLYVRGGTSNTLNLDNEHILFKLDSTGTYTDNSGGQSSFTWSFTNSQKTTLTWVVQFNPVTTVNWEILTLSKDSIKYNEYYTSGSQNEYATEVRIPF